jgi:multidrug efflux pump subunit AcrA (membrane-fusion protein)
MSTTVKPAAALPSPDALRELHARLGAAAREVAAGDEFYRQYITETVDVLGVVAGAVWIADRTGRPRLVAQYPIEAGPLASFEPLVRNVFAEGFGTIVPPDGPTAASRPADAKTAKPRRNPTEWIAMLYPVRLGTTTQGVTLVLLDAGVPRAMLPDLGRVLVPICDFAAEFLYRTTAEAATHTDGGSAEDDDATLAQFALRAHAGLDLHRTAQTVAGEVRRLVDCDRVGIGLYQRRQATALAFSGQDHFDRRSNLVRCWERLAGTVAATGEPLTFPIDDERPLPQIESALAALVEESQARHVVVVPLAVGDDEPIAVLTVEQIGAGRQLSPTARRRLTDLAPHAATALANAVRHETLPFRFLATLPLAARAATSLRNLPRTLLVGGLLAATIGALVFVPWDFTVEAPGTLQPVVRREVFAAADGTVDQIYVRSGDQVAAGAPLLDLRNTELDFGEADLLKQINETEQELLNAERFYKQGRNLTPEDQSRLPGQIALLEQRRENLNRQAVLMNEKRRQLRITSPLAGQVATWNVTELLAQRPVRRGQALLSLVDPAGEWEVEVRLPEDRLGSVVEAQRDLRPDLDVTFLVATEPGKEYVGKVEHVSLAAEPHGEEGNVVKLRAAVDKRQLTHLHPGADVRVRVHCGSRSLGYVLFHDVWAFVQSRILFRL